MCYLNYIDVHFTHTHTLTTKLSANINKNNKQMSVHACKMTSWQSVYCIKAVSILAKRNGFLIKMTTIQCLRFHWNKEFDCVSCDHKSMPI